jgi:hypothetical protein
MMTIDAENALMAYSIRILAAALVAFAIQARNAPAQTSRPTTPPATYVRPIEMRGLQERLKALPQEERNMIRLYIEAARREALKPEDGCFPITPPVIAPRNWAERAKGAAVLASLEGYWPEDLRRQCREKARELVREVAMAHRAKPNFAYEWQASYWASEAAIAGWFLWDELDADLRDAVAEMVVFQADRFINRTPKMSYQGNTEAETVSWDSSIVTLAVNMMPEHPHHSQWDQAAKRYVYNIFAAPQDMKDETTGDDGKPVRDWIVGANLYEDFALENHQQFHIDYVLASYRYLVQGAAMYGLTGRPLPAAFHHHARDMYEKVLLRCMDGDGSFVYVSDNDWKRYHAWTESCSIHALIAMLEHHPLAAALERRALTNASRYWQAMTPGFAFDNPYVCGKAWTSRIADAVLLHLTRPADFPKPLPDADIDSQLAGTTRIETADLLSHYDKQGNLTSWCKGKKDVHIRFVAPAKDAWMLLPIVGSYEPLIDGKPVLGKCVSQCRNGADWFWIVSQDEAGRGEAFISLPDSTAIYVHDLPAKTLPQSTDIVNGVAVEKPFSHVAFHFDGGQATYAPGQGEWQFEGDKREVVGNWANLQNQIGWVVKDLDTAATPSIHLPAPGKRGRLEFVSHAANGHHARFIFALPGQASEATQAASKVVQCSRDKSGAPFYCRTPEFSLIINMTSSETVIPSSENYPGDNGKVTVLPRTVVCWRRGGQRLF